jgi:chromosome segregation ATPase
MSSTPQQPTYIIPPPAGANWKTPVLIGVIALLAAANIFLYVQLDRLKTDNRAEFAKLSTDLNGAIEKMRIDSSAEVQRSRRSVDELQKRLAQQRRAAELAVGQAKVDAQQKVEQLQQRVSQEQAAQQAAISQVKTTADTATAQISTVSTDLGNTKTQLDQTIANLKHATGELDNHTSLIATNGKELQALRDLGERNYSEFTITKSKQPTRVGDVMVALKKADPKHNRFTIAISVDDKTVEKKDRSINEPIQFYTSKARQPDELVVNSVSKDKITGYLAIPKVQNARAGS